MALIYSYVEAVRFTEQTTDECPFFLSFSLPFYPPSVIFFLMLRLYFAFSPYFLCCKRYSLFHLIGSHGCLEK